MIGRKRLDYFQIATVLSDVQQAVNSRPLTYVYSEDSSRIITPNSFLKLDTGRSLFIKDSGGDLHAPNREDILSSLNYREDLMVNFKELWAEEYILSLRELDRNRYEKQWSDRIAPGDLVLIQTPNKSRYLWHMGRVTSLLTGDDGKTRTVKVLHYDKSEGIHPIKNLYPMEINVEPAVITAPEKIHNPDEAAKGSRRTLPNRAAADRCRQLLRVGN